MVLALLLVLVVSGCSRLTFMRQDTSRGDFESTAHEVVITNSGKSGASGALARVQMAQQSLAKGDFAGAETEAKKALKVDLKSAGAYTVLAIVQDHNGNAALAGQHYRRAAELAPTQGGMLNNYGTWLCSQGRAAESLAWFEQAMAAPGYQTPAVAAGNAGACALQAGQTVRAEQSLRQAIALDPQNQVALSAMAELEFKSGRMMSARAFSQRRLAAAPADPSALLLASQIEQKLGDRKAAEAYVRRLRTEFPDSRNSEPADDGRQ
ncbi:MAG: type IV pilus biogenesis/stability protein PilW [Lysobacter sp.]